MNVGEVLHLDLTHSIMACLKVTFLIQRDQKNEGGEIQKPQFGI
jgi:hypothetical protein